MLVPLMSNFWAWGTGAFGGDTVFGSKTDVENLKPVFDAASMQTYLFSYGSQMSGKHIVGSTTPLTPTARR